MPALGWPLEEEGGPQRGSQGLEVILMAPRALLQTLNLSGATLCRITATMSCPGLREGALPSPLANEEWRRLGNGQFYPKGNSLFLIFKESYFNTIPVIHQDKICPISCQTSSNDPILFLPVHLPTPTPTVYSQPGSLSWAVD